MADEQVIVDIKVNSEDVKKADKRIDELTSSIEKLSKEITDARNNNKKYHKTLADLDKQLDAGTISTDAHRKQTKLLKDEIDKNNRKIAEESIELSKLKRERTANIKLINSETASLSQLEAKASLLNQQITKQTKATKEGREEFSRLEKELAQVNKEINIQRKSFNDYTKNIGNYPEVAQPTIISLKKLGDGMENVGGASGQAVSGIKSIGQSFKALLSNPIVALLAAIVAGLSGMFKAFKSTESGARLLDRASNVLSGTWYALTKQMSGLGNEIEGGFKKGEKATTSFWEALKKNIVYRLQSIFVLFQALGEGIKALFSGNSDEIQKSMDKAKNAVTVLVTGTTIEGLKKFGGVFKQVSEDAAEFTERLNELDAAQKVSRSASRYLEQDIAKLQASFDALSESAGDDTQNLEVQRQAAIEAGKVAAKLAEQEEKLAKTRLSIISKEVAIKKDAGQDIQDLLDQQSQAQVALTEAVSRNAIAQQKILIEQRKIERDQFEQNLDILIDVGDKIKTEQEKIIQNESLSLDKRKELLNSSRDALEANFSAIKKEYELYGVTAEQINEIINSSDAKQTNEKLKALGLNEIANNRLREIILERKQAELDFADLDKKLTDEGIDRKAEANAKIDDLQKELYISQIKNAEELRDALIKFEKRKLELLLSDEKLLDEERRALALESENKIAEIKQKFREEEKEKREEEFEEQKEFLSEQFEEINEIVTEFAGQETAIFGKIASSIGNSFSSITDIIDDDFEKSIDKVKALAQATAEALTGINNAVFESLAERRDIDLQNIEASRQKELELAKGNSDAQKVINEKYDKEVSELKLKQFKADKAKALIDIAIQTAVAVVKALPNIPLSITMGALGVAQGVLVSSKQPPKFARGTNDIVSIGGSHASGNDVDVWGFSGGKKQYFGKVERGEAMPVIRKSAVNDYLVAKLNGKFSPNSGRKFQDGTPDITSATSEQLNNQQFINNMVAAFSNIKIVTKIEDITKQAAKKNEIINNSKV